MLTARLLSKIFKKSGIVLIDSQGQKYICGKPDLRNPLTLKLLKKDLNWKLVLNPDLNFPEAYIRGEIEFENGSLIDFLNLFFENIGRKEINIYGYMVKKVLHAWRFVTNYNLPTKSKKNVKHHYDKGEDLYDLFLDKKHRQYSCAYFLSPDESLEDAQQNKINHIIKKLDLRPGQKILDIGCGWGGMALQIAKDTGASVKGITLSENQFATAQRRAQEEGLNEKVTFALQDYRHETNIYDRIVSVGMFEHVGVNYFPVFFSKTYEILKDTGVFLLHTIGQRSKPSATSPWIRKYIFPGGYIPSLSEILQVCEKQNINITDIEILRLHYAQTLKHWYSNFLKNKNSIIKMFDERFFRMWEYYLLISQFSFWNMGNVVFQIQMSKNLNNLPLTRNYIYN